MKNYLELETAVSKAIYDCVRYRGQSDVSGLYDELTNLLLSTKLEGVICVSLPPVGCSVVRSQNFQVFYNKESKLVNIANKFF